MNDQPEIAWGAAAIGKVLNQTERQTYYMLEKGQVPGARKVAGKWALSIPIFRREMHGDAGQAG